MHVVHFPPLSAGPVVGVGQVHHPPPRPLVSQEGENALFAPHTINFNTVVSKRVRNVSDKHSKFPVKLPAQSFV